MDVANLAGKANPWWVTGRVSEKYRKMVKRGLFFELVKYLPDKQVITVTGLRRVGKTTLMHQVIDELLKKNNSENIFYFLFNSFHSKPEDLERVIEFYLNNIAPEKGRKYLFLDEVQYVKGWADVIKSYYDLHDDLKFFISGSASLYIRKSTKESLAGRAYDFFLSSLSFKEFLLLKKTRLPLDVVEKPLKYESVLSVLFNEFVLKGGFPEIVSEEDFEKRKLYVSSVISKITSIDIPSVFEVRDVRSFPILLRLLASSVGKTVEYSSLAESVEKNRRTVSDYVKYLEEAFVIKELFTHSGSEFSKARKSKKLYFTEHSVISSMLDKSKAEVFESLFSSLLVENIIFNSLKPVSFWRKDKEVDFIIKFEGELIPVEVKYKENLTSTDFNGLRKFMKSNKTFKAIMITKKTHGVKKLEEGKVLLIPAWLITYAPKEVISKINLL